MPSSCRVPICFSLFPDTELSGAEKRHGKTLLLVLACIISNLIHYAVNILLGYEEFSFAGLIINMMPADYFVIPYCVIYLFSPYINRFMENFSERKLLRFLIMAFLCFSVWPFVRCPGSADRFPVVAVSESGRPGFHTARLYRSQFLPALCSRRLLLQGTDRGKAQPYRVASDLFCEFCRDLSYFRIRHESGCCLFL